MFARFRVTRNSGGAWHYHWTRTPHRAASVTVNAQIVNVTQNVSYVGQGACVKLGESYNFV